MPTFTSLVEDMLVSAKQLDQYLSDSGKQPTSFEDDTLIDLSPEMEAIRDKLVDSAQVTKRLALGTRGTYSEILFAFADEISLRAIYKYSLASCIPLDSTATFSEISAKSGLREDLVERFLRQAMSNRIFTETTPGNVAHTASSRVLVQDPDSYDAIGLLTCDLSPAGMRTLDALDKFSASSEPHKTGWNVANDTELGLYQDLARQPERARRFGAGMRYFGKGAGWDLAHLVRAFDWGTLDSSSSTTPQAATAAAVFVDVGGGHGTVSQALARSTQHVHFIVEDLPGTCEAGRAALPAELAGRVEFRAHDFFEDQSVRNADVYFFRWILHNWADEYCVRMLRALIPALKKGARVVNYEFVLREGPEESWTRRQPRNLDLLMQAQFNAPERTEAAWRKLFHSADPRLRLASIQTPPGSLMSIITAVWDGE